MCAAFLSRPFRRHHCTMGSLTALEETALARGAAGVVHWRTWGPMGGAMMPVGWLPAATPPPLREWSFAEWEARALAAGLSAKPLQEPLYYFHLFDKIWAIERSAPTCSHQGCGRVVSVWGVMVRHYARRQDLCAGCAANLGKRGLLPLGLIPAGVPRRLWGRVLRECGAVRPAA